MFEPALASPSSPARARAVIRLRRGAQIGPVISCQPSSRLSKHPRAPCNRRNVAALITFLVAIIVSFVPLVGFATTAARACACGCSVFDVGGLDLPQEQEHGGRVFFEFWSGDQTQNWVGSSRAPAAINSDKEINTQWYNVGFSYNFNRDWGVMVRVPTANRALTTDTGASPASYL